MGQFALAKSPSIHQLRPWHRSMAREMAAGMRPSELAMSFGYSAGQISRIIQSPLFVAELARIEAQAEVVVVDVNQDLKTMSEKASEILDRELEREAADLPTVPERKLAVATCFGVLDRSGYGKKEQPVSKHLHQHLHVEKMSDEELYNDVLDITQEDE